MYRNIILSRIGFTTKTMKCAAHLLRADPRHGRNSLL